MEHEDAGLLSAGEGGRIVGSGKQDATSTGGDIEGLDPSALCMAK